MSFVELVAKFLKTLNLRSITYINFYRFTGDTYVQTIEKRLKLANVWQFNPGNLNY